MTAAAVFTAGCPGISVCGSSNSQSLVQLQKLSLSGSTRSCRHQQQLPLVQQWLWISVS